MQIFYSDVCAVYLGNRGNNMYVVVSIVIARVVELKTKNTSACFVSFPLVRGL